MYLRIVFPIFVLAFAPIISAQTPLQSQRASGTAIIAGNVKIGDQPAGGISLVLMPDRQNRRQQAGPGRPDESNATAVTDEKGEYRFTNVAAGQYRVILQTEAFVVSGDGIRAGGIAVNVTDGQTISNLDFSLARGGVITGRVTDHTGRPVIAERINLMVVNETGQTQQFNGGARFGFETDDRGIYRVYGLPAGRYLVSAGSGNNFGGPGPRAGIGRRILYPRTFHPDAVEQSQAEIVEVTSGAVAENIDIRMGAPIKTYAVSGRAVDAETTQPVFGVPINVLQERRGPAPAANSGTTNAEGEFRITGLLPGQYSVSVRPINFSSDSSGETAPTSSEYYSDPASFEISSDDATGVEVRVHRGASIAGVVVVEGSNDASIAGKLSQLMVFANSRGAQTQGQSQRQGGQGGTSGRSTLSPVGSDGSFRISGLAPGNARLSINNGGGGFGGPGGGAGAFRLVRIERNGSPINGDFPITSGESVTGVRIIVGYGSGVIQGRVVVTGGTLPPGARLSVTARALNSTAGSNSSNSPGQGINARVDPTREFMISNLLPGSYELRLTAFMPSGGPGGGGGGRPGGGGGRGGNRGGGSSGGSGTTPTNMPEVRQVVSVTNGSPASVTLTLNLSQ